MYHHWGFNCFSDIFSFFNKGTLGSTGVSHDPFKPDKPGVVTLLNKLIQIVEWPHPMPKGTC